MALSSRLATAIHIVSILRHHRDEFVKSEYIAHSVNTNAVVVRRIVGMLTKAGLVVAQSGSNGGAKLKLCPNQINLLDVYNAVEDEALFSIHEGNSDCPLSFNLKEVLEEKLGDIEKSMKENLSKITVEQIFNETEKRAQ
ncbi:MAG: Rrf2 family transcriptional regulator [Candidatus Sericytochromatia bacterium]